MTAPRTPGVYIEEFHFASTPIQGVATSTAGFIAVTGRGPLLGPLFACQTGREVSYVRGRVRFQNKN
jgi:phage tail sheath protein FI